MLYYPLSRLPLFILHFSSTHSLLTLTTTINTATQAAMAANSSEASLEEKTDHEARNSHTVNIANSHV